MKKAGYIIALLMEIIFYTGAYIFNYFTRRKMGMSRYVVFLNRQIEEAVPIQSIIYAGVGVMILLLMIGLVIFWKKRKKPGKLPFIMSIVSVITTVLYVYYALANNVGTERSYYVLSIFFLAAGIIQHVKTIIGCVVCKKEDSKL